MSNSDADSVSSMQPKQINVELRKEQKIAKKILDSEKKIKKASKPPSDSKKYSSVSDDNKASNNQLEPEKGKNQKDVQDSQFKDNLSKASKNSVETEVATENPLPNPSNEVKENNICGTKEIQVAVDKITEIKGLEKTPNTNSQKAGGDMASSPTVEVTAEIEKKEVSNAKQNDLNLVVVQSKVEIPEGKIYHIEDMIKQNEEGAAKRKGIREELSRRDRSRSPIRKRSTSKDFSAREMRREQRRQIEKEFRRMARDDSYRPGPDSKAYRSPKAKRRSSDKRRSKDRNRSHDRRDDKKTSKDSKSRDRRNSPESSRSRNYYTNRNKDSSKDQKNDRSKDSSKEQKNDKSKDSSKEQKNDKSKDSSKEQRNDKNINLLKGQSNESKNSTNDVKSSKRQHPEDGIARRSQALGRQRKPVDLITSKTGGAYIPPAKLRMLQDEITDKSSAAYQRIAWEALKKSIHGYINKVNVDNIGIITRELFKENIVRGRGLLCRSIIQAQAASPTFTHVYAALVSIINSKFPNIGELLLKRLVIQFKRGFRRNDKALCLSSTRFIAHLVNQRTAHEILALEILTLLVETPTDDSIEVAICFLKECGMKLTEVSIKGINAIFEMLKNILHEGKLDKRVQYMIEVVFQVRKDGFKDFQSVIDDLELVEEDDQFTHLIMLDEATEAQDVLNVYKFDDQYQENEEKYKELSKELLGSDIENSDGSEKGSEDSGDDDDDANADADNEAINLPNISDRTENNLVGLRRTIYLTIHSSLDYEECAHKLMKMQLKPGQELELCHMFLDCCAEQRTYEKFYGLLAQRFCNINKAYVDPFEQIFRDTYATTHRLDTNRLRNVSKFFAHLLFTNSISWSVFDCIRLSEDDTTSSSRIFVKILFQELAEYLGLSKLNDRLKDSTYTESFTGLFPRENPKSTRFSINFFTSIGLGGLTDDLRQHLKSVPKIVPVLNTEIINVDDKTSSGSSDSSPSSLDGSSSSSSTDTPKKKSKKKVKRVKQKKRKNSASSSSSSSTTSRRKNDSNTSDKSSESDEHIAKKRKRLKKKISKKIKKKNRASTTTSTTSTSGVDTSSDENRENPNESKKYKQKSPSSSSFSTSLTSSSNSNENKKNKKKKSDTSNKKKKTDSDRKDNAKNKDSRIPNTSRNDKKEVNRNVGNTSKSYRDSYDQKTNKDYRNREDERKSRRMYSEDRYERKHHSDNRADRRNYSDERNERRSRKRNRRSKSETRSRQISSERT